MKRLENTTESGFSTRIAPPLMQNAGEARMHKSLLNIGIAAVLVLLLVCCGAAAADENVAEVTVDSVPTTYTDFVAAWTDATSEANKSKPVTVKLLDNITNSTLIVSNSDSGSLTLDLHGFVLNNTGGGSVIKIESNGNLTLKDSGSTAHWFEYAAVGNAWTLYTGNEPTNGGTNKVYTSLGNFNRTEADTFLSTSGNKVYIKVTGGVITGGSATKGGGVYVDTNGEFTMMGGNIVGNKATDKEGGGVYVNGGNFTMCGGNIAGNRAANSNTGEGGGVYVNGSTFEMYGGNITGNGANSNGGGVFVTSHGSFTMSGDASITGNRAETNGGGVYVNNDGTNTFEMYGNANITGNSAKNGGGVFVFTYGIFTMSGGSITGNNAGANGGGVVNGGAFFNVSGTSVISGNKNSAAANNVYLPNTKYITVTGALQDGAKIGVTTQNSPSPTSPLINITEESGDNRRYFASDIASYEINYLNNKHALVYRYGITYKDKGDTEFSGTHESDYPTTHTYGTATALKRANKAGHTFGGWFTTSGCSGTPVTSLDATESGTTDPITLYAKWTADPQPPAPSSGSSRNYGASVWLTATPTPTPTAEATPEPTQAQPTASPIKPQQASSPAPAAGIIAGLGAAALVFGLRRK